MLHLAAIFIFLQALVAPSFSAPVADVDGESPAHYVYLYRRAQTFACTSGGATNKVPMRLGETGDAIVQLHGGSATFLNYKDGDLEGTIEKVSSQPAGSKGEHLVEVQILKKALESKGGACDTLIAETDPEKRQTIRANINEVLTLLNGKDNLFFAEATLEGTKGDVANKALQGKKGVKGTDANFVNRMQAVDDYLNKKFKTQSVGVATAMDAKLKQLFPGTSVSCAITWNVVLDFAKSEAARVLKESCAAAGSSTVKRQLAAKGAKGGGSPAVSCPIKKPTTSAKKPATAATKPATAATKPTTAAKKPTTAATKPTTAAKKPATAATKPTTAAKKPATAATKPTTTAKKPTTAAKKPATAAKKPTTAAKKPVTAAKKPVTAAKKPVTATKKPTTAAKKSTATKKV